MKDCQQNDIRIIGKVTCAPSISGFRWFCLAFLLGCLREQAHPAGTGTSIAMAPGAVDATLNILA